MRQKSVLCVSGGCYGRIRGGPFILDNDTLGDNPANICYYVRVVVCSHPKRAIPGNPNKFITSQNLRKSTHKIFIHGEDHLLHQNIRQLHTLFAFGKEDIMLLELPDSIIERVLR